MTTATIFTQPGCTACRVTRRALTKMGVHVNEELIHDHQDKLDLMHREGWTALPLVEVDLPEGVVVWSGMSDANLTALRFALDESD